MRLEGKVIIITGASRYIGQAMAVRLAKEGAKVVVADIRDCTETVEMAQAESAEALSIQVDVTDEAQTLEMARQTVERFGRIDCLRGSRGWSGRIDLGKSFRINILTSPEDEIS